MKLTRKQIELIKANTKPELKGKAKTIDVLLGHYTKAGANWSYLAGWTKDGELVVTVFGDCGIRRY